MRNGRRVLVACLFIVALVASLVSVVWRQATGVALDSEIQRVHGAANAALAEHRQLNDELRRLESRSRITAFARDSLGMRLPLDHEVVMLPVDPPRERSEARW